MSAGTGTVDTAKFYWSPIARTLTTKIPVPLPGREPQHFDILDQIKTVQEIVGVYDLCTLVTVQVLIVRY